MKKGFKEFFSYLMIMIGALMAAFSVACILLPNDAIDYGTAGVALIVSKMTGYLHTATKELWTLLFNVKRRVF